MARDGEEKQAKWFRPAKQVSLKKQGTMKVIINKSDLCIQPGLTILKSMTDPHLDNEQCACYAPCTQTL